MNKSLREQLNNFIQVNNQVPYNDIKFMCENGKFGKYYKISNAERRLRKSESPNVEAIIQNGAIKFYRWVGDPIKKQVYRVLDDNGNVEKEIEVIKI